jgi:enoyl-CoA hydratase/carnithine racemase
MRGERHMRSAGLHFVADCDIVIAADTAQFTDTHTTVGQISAIEAIDLARRIPLGAVLRMVMLGKAERLRAAKALELNMVSEVVPADRLMDRARELAHLAASTSPAATQASLQAICESFEVPLSEAYRSGYEILIRHREHPDTAEGPAAFLEKRSPVWAP